MHYSDKMPKKIKGDIIAVVNYENRFSIAQNHSATHLLHQALREILGKHIEQRGSFLNSNMFRFDFSHFSKISNEELILIQNFVNKKINEKINLIENRNVNFQDAIDSGAIGIFGEKYDDKVRTIKFGKSFELCGGTHVKNTSEIWFFKIISETSIASGVRRIEAITGKSVKDYFNNREKTIIEVSNLLKQPQDIIKSIKSLQEENTILKKEVEELVGQGTREIILLGQNVNAYNYKEGNKEFRLSDLLKKLEEFNQLKRVRYTTSHPKDMTEDLINFYKISNKLMPLVHLPVQSGSNKILELMNRKHTIEEYLLIHKKLKMINKNIKFSSDFIIGYPGEEDEDFEKTMDLINKIKFINSYSFIYSPRPGTSAANLEVVDNDKTKKRLEIIQKKLFENQLERNKSLENTVINVLVENRMKDGVKLFGRTEFMTSVIFDGSEENIGNIVQVKITGSNQNSLFGILKENYNKRVA